jgi:hypothetical protein
MFHGEAGCRTQGSGFVSSSRLGKGGGSGGLGRWLCYSCFGFGFEWHRALLLDHHLYSAPLNAGDCSGEETRGTRSIRPRNLETNGPIEVISQCGGDGIPFVSTRPLTATIRASIMMSCKPAESLLAEREKKRE